MKLKICCDKIIKTVFLGHPLETSVSEEGIDSQNRLVSLPSLSLFTFKKSIAGHKSWHTFYLYKQHSIYRMVVMQACTNTLLCVPKGLLFKLSPLPPHLNSHSLSLSPSFRERSVAP